MAKSLKQLEIDLKNAQNDKNPLPNDKFVENMAISFSQESVKCIDLGRFPLLCWPSIWRRSGYEALLIRIKHHSNQVFNFQAYP